jgi:hypothetical protein
VSGNNANAGTSASAPKRDLSGFDIDALPAGTQLLFARGGSWSGFNVALSNRNVTAAAPLVFDSYAPAWGGTARPWLRTSGGMAFLFGSWNETANDGGYTIRNLKLDGLGTSDWGFWLRNAVHHVTLENLEVTGFKLAVHSQAGSTENANFVLRNSLIHRNSDMGVLGEFTTATIEGNTFEANNFSGSFFNHAIYLGGHGTNGVIRNNRFVRNSVVNGVCTGGNVTVHGQWDGLLIEGNTIEQSDSQITCYGFSLNPGYDQPEWMRNVVLRNNTMIDVGCGICTSSTPGILVEGNRVIQTVPRAAGINVGLAVPDPGDVADSGAVVRNNTACYVVNDGQAWVRVGGTGATTSNNALVTGSAATTGVCAR